MAKRKARRISKPQPEQNVLYFISEATDQVIDCSAALSAINRKQYHMTKNYKPLAYHLRAQCITTGSDSTPILFSSAANTWTTKNALTMFGIQFAKQLKNSGITKSMLPKYGKEIRYGLLTDYGHTHASGSDGFSGTANLDSSGGGKVYNPEDYGGTSVFASYTNQAGNAVTYYTSNELTSVSLTKVAPDDVSEVIIPSILGTSDHNDNDFAVVPEYLIARRNAHDHEHLDGTLPSDTSMMLRIGAMNEEHLDDIIDALEDVGDTRPYSTAGANQLVPQGALMAAGDYCSMVAPCGLLRVDSNADAKFLVTVTAITEM